MPAWIEYQGKKILRGEYQNKSIEDYLAEIRASVDIIKSANLPPKSLLYLGVGNIPDGHFDEGKEAWRVYNIEVKEWVLAQATVGLKGFTRVIARLMDRTMYFAADEEDAKQWLVKQVAQ